MNDKRQTEPGDSRAGPAAGEQAEGLRGELLMTKMNGVSCPRLVIGLDAGLCAPGPEFFNACVGLFDGHSTRHLFDALVYTGDELRIGKRKISRAQGLQFCVLGFGDEENEADRIGRHIKTSNLKWGT